MNLTSPTTQSVQTPDWEHRRLYFLDNLRAVVILLVIVLHASITYMAFGPPWWYVVDTETSLAFTQLVLLIDVPIMPAMFFVAGYFALPALQKRGPRRFLRDKIVRVGLPWILGALLLAPPTAYLIYYSRQVPMSFLEFWATDYWGPLYQQSVYWFLGVLMLLFSVLAAAYTLGPRIQTAVPRPEPRPIRPLLLFSIVVTATFLLINLFYGIDDWAHIYLFVYQPVRVPLYVGYFCLGIYAFLRGWFTGDGFNPNGGLWVTAAVLTGVGYLGCRMTPDGGAGLFLATGILYNAFCLSTLLASLALFQAALDLATPFWRSQAANSYGIYYVHPLILYPLAYLLVGTSLPIGLKALLLIGITGLLSWGISALVLKRLPFLSDMF